MAGRHPLRSRLLCGTPLRDGSPCRAAAIRALDGKCENHGVVAKGAEFGWRVRGSRRAGVYVAERGSEVLVADTASDLLVLIRGNG
jgi:hypothetical protein